MPPDQTLHFGPYRLAGAHGPLWRGAQVVPLPPKALAVLWQLASQAGQVVTKDALLEAGWAGMVVSEAALTTCLRTLRQALGEDAQQPRYIATVHRLGYRFVAPVAAGGPVTPAGPPPVAPAPAPLLVGRAAELAHLHAGFAQARQGGRQLIFVTGEAGIGKTTLVDAFLTEVAAAQTAWIGRGQCIESYGAGEAYLPVLEALARLGRGPGGVRLVACLRQYAPTWLAQLPALVDEAARVPLERQGLGVTAQRMLRELAEALEALTAVQPLLVVLEDLHWSDASTVEALALLARRREAARVMVIGTYRPVELILRPHPLKAVKPELALHGHCREVPLGPLSVAEVQAYLAQRGLAADTTADLAAWVQRRTEGHPLFMVHVVDELAHQGGLPDPEAAAPARRLVAAEAEIPAGLEPLIELQLGQLGAEAQQVLEVASVVGVEFAEASVAAALALPLETIAACCEGLVRQGQFLEDRGLAEWPDGTVSGRYGFRHALYQEILYGRLGSARRLRGHRAIGVRLEAGYGAQAAEIAAALAVHFERGQDHSRAVRYRQQAAQRAMQRSAHLEAIRHCTTGIELLKTLPATPEHTQQALTLYIVLGAALLMTKGQAAPEVEHAYTQARTLCQQVGEPPELVPILLGLWRVYLVRPQLHTARELGDTLLRLAQRAHDPALAVLAHDALGSVWLCLGALPAARQHLEEGIARYTPDQRRAPVFHMGGDPGVGCQAHAAVTLWLMGYPAQALARLHEALALAHELSHPFSLAWVRGMAAWVSQLRRDVLAVYEQAEACVALSTEQGFPLWAAWGTSLRGWAMALQGQGEEGLAQVRQGLAAWQATGAALQAPYVYTMLADVCNHLGYLDDSLQALAEAHTLVEQQEERWWEAEVSRLQGVLLLRQTGTPQEEAETWLWRALEVAHRQEAKSLELRAAVSLSRLWQQGKWAEAQALLAPIYAWFTEGFDTADLQEAEALLEELGR